jgi:hypothetical protein
MGGILSLASAEINALSNVDQHIIFHASRDAAELRQHLATDVIPVRP